MADEELCGGEDIDGARELVQFNLDWTKRYRPAPFTDEQLAFLKEWLAQSLSSLRFDVEQHR